MACFSPLWSPAGVGGCGFALKRSTISSKLFAVLFAHRAPRRFVSSLTAALVKTGDSAELNGVEGLDGRGVYTTTQFAILVNLLEDFSRIYICEERSNIAEQSQDLAKTEHTWLGNEAQSASMALLEFNRFHGVL